MKSKKRIRVGVNAYGHIRRRRRGHLIGYSREALAKRLSDAVESVIAEWVGHDDPPEAASASGVARWLGLPSNTLHRWITAQSHPTNAGDRRKLARLGVSLSEIGELMQMDEADNYHNALPTPSADELNKLIGA